MKTTKITIGDVSFKVYEGGREKFWKKINEGRWEPYTIQIFNKFITKETTMLDIGAWIGVTSLYAAKKAKRVVSFEPDVTAFKQISENIQLNPDVNNVELNNACVGVENGTVMISPQNEPGDSSSSILLAIEGEGWEVPSLAFDQLIVEKEIMEPIFIKMDVEGYEYELAPILVNIFRKYDVTLCLSTHPRVFSLRNEKESKDGDFVKKLFGVVKARYNVMKASMGIAKLQSGNTVYNCKGRKINLWVRLLFVLMGKDFVRKHTFVVSSNKTRK